MNFTLYIDESGDFETARGQWVVAGVLIADNYTNCEKFLTNKLQLLPRQLGLRSIEDFHLTELRAKFGHAKAIDLVKTVYQKLDGLPISFQAIATVNRRKSSLSSREKTYRLMLSDILAICETTIPDGQVIKKLDLVVASRTINGQLQTSLSNIDREIIQTLPIALEVDLATKGLVDIMGKNLKVHIDYATNSWGLVCADFLANLTYHNKKDKESKFLEELKDKGKYTVFESSGSFDVRRAFVAERNNDYVLALYRWLLIGHKSKDTGKTVDAIQRLLVKTFTFRGTSGPNASLEALIEMLWRNHNSFEEYSMLSSLLHTLDIEMCSYLDRESCSTFGNLLFRLRNFRLLVENHLGRTKDAFSIIEQQNSLIPVLATIPEFFPKVLDFKVLATETYINALDLEKALSLATEHSKMMKSFREVWALLLNDDELSGFRSSRSYIKSEMSLLRINILCLGFCLSMVDTDISEHFLEIEPILTNNADLNRFNNYQVMLLLKQFKPEKAVQLFFEKYCNNNTEDFSSFDTFWFLMALNDALLASKEIDMVLSNKIIEDQLAHINLNQIGHPIDLILRELALFEYLKGNNPNAKRYISKCAKAFDLGESEISIFLKTCINIYDDFINEKLTKSGDYFYDLPRSFFIKSILDSELKLSFFRKLRYFFL